MNTEVISNFEKYWVKLVNGEVMWSLPVRRPNAGKTEKNHICDKSKLPVT
jgi:hypothetical protein